MMTVVVMTSLQRLRTTESSDRLTVQINAYLDNMIDVKLLLDDSEMKSAALERAEELEMALSQVRQSTAHLMRHHHCSSALPTFTRQL